MIVKFTVPDAPIAQPRQRQRVMVMGGRKPIVKNYIPTLHPVNVFKATCRQAAHEAYSGAPLLGPLQLDLVFVLPRPGNLMWKKKPMPRIPHDHAPDMDNLTKAFKDAMKGLLWKDDGQVARLTAEKFVAAGDEQPHVLVEVAEYRDAVPDALACARTA